MNITLTLGWWMIPAILPLVITSFLAAVFLFDKDGDSSKAMLGLGILITILTLLTRYL